MWKIAIINSLLSFFCSTSTRIEFWELFYSMATKRKDISKKVRFEIFKRDGFSCRYCNAKPPNTTLEIDHIVPVSKGGDNSDDNLITSCFNCNRGKSANTLDCVTDSMAQKMERKKEALKQYKDYLNILANEKKQIESDIDLIQDIYGLFFIGYTFSVSFRLSVKGFIYKIGIEECLTAMEKACKRNLSSEETTRYFCGICWAKIKENE